MGFMTLLKIFTKLVKGEDLLAFMISAFIAYLVGSFLPEGPWVSYVFILLFYHLFLTWVVIDPDRKKIHSVSIAPTIVMHLTVLSLIVGFIMARSSVPFFVILRFSIVGLAIAERRMLSTWTVEKKEVPVVDAKAAAISAAAAEVSDSLTGEEYEEWVSYLSKRDPLSVKAGTTVKQEYEQWLLARARNRSVVSSNASPA
ncbi:MAG: hypothetical protein ABSF28_07165 [Terracidiphilus sp.]|jgi:hypothetical protein